jgi:thioredoxin:protein disulfide reductase
MGLQTPDIRDIFRRQAFVAERNLVKSNRYILVWAAAFGILSFDHVGKASSGFGGLGAEKALLDVKPQDVIHWQAISADVKSDGKIAVNLRLTTEQGFTLYTNKVKFDMSPGYLLDKVSNPPTRRIFDPISNEEVDVYFGGEFEIIATPTGGEIAASVPVAITYIGCTDRICLFPYTETIQVPVVNREVLSHTAASPISGGNLSPETRIDTAQDLASKSTTERQQAADFETGLASILQADSTTFAFSLFIALIGGLLTNLTPCVYPMIPITIRLLARGGISPTLGASAYSAGIMLTYSSLGLFAAWSGSLFGSLSANIGLNIAFSVLMAFLAFSMLGGNTFGWLQRVGNRIGTGKPTLKNTFLMGTGAGLVASPCTGPILATLLAYTARSNDPARAVSLVVVYSFGFAFPYLLLGRAAGHLNKVKLPAIAQWSVKLLFSAIMFTLSFYYLRVPAYRLAQTLQPYWGQVSGISLAVGLAALAGFIAKESWRRSAVLTGVPAILLGLSLFSGWQWYGARGAQNGIHWHKTEADAEARASADGKPIIIDAWAEWCEACKKMDVKTFGDPEVVAELNANWVVLKMDLTENSDKDIEFQQRYGLLSLPTIILKTPTDTAEQSKKVTGFVSAGELLNELRQFRGK